MCHEYVFSTCQRRCTRLHTHDDILSQTMPDFASTLWLEAMGYLPGRILPMVFARLAPHVRIMCVLKSPERWGWGVGGWVGEGGLCRRRDFTFTVCCAIFRLRLLVSMNGFSQRGKFHVLLQLIHWHRVIVVFGVGNQSFRAGHKVCQRPSHGSD